ncbi:MAG TPA: VOC family protein [Thermoplasmata archaeon]|nr:VOC family protein [Thermoplasmata archaeon]
MTEGSRLSSNRKELPIKVLFVAGFGPIVSDPKASRALYAETLGVRLKEMGDGYAQTEHLAGAKSFGLWPLEHAAQSCFGVPEWPSNVPRPQAWLEFDVEDIATATSHLAKHGYRLLVSARREPWGQTVTRFLSPEGILLGVTHTPAMRPK